MYPVGPAYSIDDPGSRDKSRESLEVAGWRHIDLLEGAFRHGRRAIRGSATCVADGSPSRIRCRLSPAMPATRSGLPASGIPSRGPKCPPEVPRQLIRDAFLLHDGISSRCAERLLDPTLCVTSLTGNRIDVHDQLH